MAEERILACIRRIDRLEPIPDADRIVLAHAGGWQAVVKKEEFKEGDLAVYCEIDSWIPHEIAPFLTKKEKKPKEYEGVKGERLKTIRLRGCLSQGLFLPLSVLPEKTPIQEGLDVSGILGIRKWEEPPMEENRSFCLAMRPFPEDIPKTRQPHVQNLNAKFFEELRNKGVTQFEVSEKLDGMSCTVFMDNRGNVRLCSHSYELNAEPAGERRDPFLLKFFRALGLEKFVRRMGYKGHGTRTERENVFQQILRESGLSIALRGLNIKNLALQGEIVGPGICRNPLKLEHPAFFLFSVWDIKGQWELDPSSRMSIFNRIRCGLLPEQHALFRHVPVLETWTLPEENDSIVDDILKMADGKSAVNPDVMREGLVFKPVHGHTMKCSFKAISNEYLLKKK